MDSKLGYFIDGLTPHYPGKHLTVSLCMYVYTPIVEQVRRMHCLPDSVCHFLHHHSGVILEFHYSKKDPLELVSEETQLSFVKSLLIFKVSAWLCSRRHEL